MMMCGFTRSGIFLSIILLLILVNPLLAVKGQSNRKEKIRQQAQEEVRQSEFVKGKSKRCFAIYVALKYRQNQFCLHMNERIFADKSIYTLELLCLLIAFRKIFQIKMKCVTVISALRSTRLLVETRKTIMIKSTLNTHFLSVEWKNAYLCEFRRILGEKSKIEL